jgi:hypothetical protein
MTETAKLLNDKDSIVIRRASPEDAEACGKICFEAFDALARHHNFQPDFPTAEVPVAVLRMMFSHPSFFCVVAQLDGNLIGSNCLGRSPSIPACKIKARGVY